MDYQLAIDPDLGISADGFAAWNETSTCRALAEAHVTTFRQPDGAYLMSRKLYTGCYSQSITSNAAEIP